MGELAVLQPRNCLKDRLPRADLIYSPIKSRRNPNPNTNPNLTRSNRRKQSPKGHRKNNPPTATVVANKPAKNLVMGEVKILKRGEALNGPGLGVERSDDLVLSSTDRLGPEPEMAPKQFRLGDLYAGSAFITSPPPSSLPLPAFFTKKSVLTEDDDATTSLRRILRMDLS